MDFSLSAHNILWFKFLVNICNKKKNKLQITEVTSPTFNILCEYDINQIKINHYDLFRLKTKEEILNLDIFNDISNTITFIEWPQIIDKKLDNLIELDFKYEENHQKSNYCNII